MVLAGGVADSALTHWLSDSSSELPKPPAAHVEMVSAPENRADAAVRRAEEARRLFFLSGGRQELSDEEITRRYLEREHARLVARAQEIADELGVFDLEDRFKIEEAVRKGCTEITGSNGKTIELKKPEPEECTPVPLAEDTGRIWVDPKDYEALSPAEKAAIDRFREQDFEGFIRQANFDDTRQRLRDFRSKEYPGREAEVRQIMEDVFTNIERLRDAYVSGDGDWVEELLRSPDAFRLPSDLSPEIQTMLEEIKAGDSFFLVETFLDVLERAI